MNRRMKFYCAAAIRGDLSYERYFQRIVKIVSEYGEPKTEKFGPPYNPLPRYMPEEDPKDYVHYRDIVHWLGESDALIAEYSGGSTGVGFEICYATRARRIPALCLYHKSSRPSLIIKQDMSKYTISQEYSDENDLEKYLRCFLEIVTRFRRIGEIRTAYSDLSQRIASSAISLNEIPKLLEPIARISRDLEVQSELKLEPDNVYIIRPKPLEIDFKDSRSFLQFMFRNMILQRRWDHLMSQRIGSTFASGRKFRIIAALSYFEGLTTISQIHRKSGEELPYTREAFTKNIRAYRKIGLIGTPERIVGGSTKFKDKVTVYKTLHGDLIVESSTSSRKTADDLITVTQHLHHLACFLTKFGSTPITGVIEEAKRRAWYSEIPEVQTTRVDDIMMEHFLVSDWAKDMLGWLGTRCKDFWSHEFSSFIEKPDSPIKSNEDASLEAETNRREH